MQIYCNFACGIIVCIRYAWVHRLKIENAAFFLTLVLCSRIDVLVCYLFAVLSATVDSAATEDCVCLF